jgi:hypothetical protein
MNTILAAVNFIPLYYYHGEKLTHIQKILIGLPLVAISFVLAIGMIGAVLECERVADYALKTVTILIALTCIGLTISLFV